MAGMEEDEPLDIFGLMEALLSYSWTTNTTS